MKKTLWVLLDDRMGSVGQAKGVMLALQDNLLIEEKKLTYTKWAALPNFLRGKSLHGIDRKKSDALDGPYPDMVLSISRRTLPVARYLRKQSGNKTKIIQLMYPGRTGLSEVELVILPEHDRKKHSPKNFFYITGCPHRVTLLALDEAAKKWGDIFAQLPKPWTTIIVGGSIQGKPFTLENARALGKAVKAFQEKVGGSILITTSRRTGEAAQDAIMEELKGIPSYTYLWGEKKENPIIGFWALADYVIVTGDTVSMCCESCGSGKPVLVFRGEQWLTPKHHRFVQSLFEGGYATPLENPQAEAFKPSQRLDPAIQIVDKILEIR